MRLRPLPDCRSQWAPQTAQLAVAFGFFLFGGGQVWADDFKLERVPSSVPVTGNAGQQSRNPTTLSCDE